MQGQTVLFIKVYVGGLVFIWSTIFLVLESLVRNLLQKIFYCMLDHACSNYFFMSWDLNVNFPKFTVVKELWTLLCYPMSSMKILFPFSLGLAFSFLYFWEWLYAMTWKLTWLAPFILQFPYHSCFVTVVTSRLLVGWLLYHHACLMQLMDRVYEFLGYLIIDRISWAWVYLKAWCYRYMNDLSCVCRWSLGI